MEFTTPGSTLYVDDTLDHTGELEFQLDNTVDAAVYAWLKRDAVLALYHHLGNVLIASAEVTWALGWYRTKRHVTEEFTDRDGMSVRAICSLYTHVYPAGYADKSYPIPAANTPEVMAKPACKVCEKKVTK